VSERAEVLDTVDDATEAGGGMSDNAYERGMRIRREVLGDAHVDAAVARTTDFTAANRAFAIAQAVLEEDGAA
jgi:hypothetical protein